MGFFSKLKKFFGGSEAAAPQTDTPAPAPDDEASAAAARDADTVQATDSGSEERAAQSTPDRTSLSSDARDRQSEPAAEAIPAAPAALERDTAADVLSVPEVPEAPEETRDAMSGADASATQLPAQDTAATATEPVSAADAAPADAEKAAPRDELPSAATISEQQPDIPAGVEDEPAATPDEPQPATAADADVMPAHDAVAEPAACLPQDDSAALCAADPAAATASNAAADETAGIPVPESGPEAAMPAAAPASAGDSPAPESAPEPASHDYAAQSSDAPVGDAAPVEQAVAAATPEEAAMTLRLRDAEPRLSVWLGIVLEGVTEADELLWSRLRFLLRSLDAPATEADAFIDDFRGWLERMEYRWLDEFRSELQYRLALALELEDEEDERSRLFVKLAQGLARTREHFARRMDALFSAHSALDDQFWEDMEELFIMADLGYEPALELVSRLKERARAAGVSDPQGVRALLQEEVAALFKAPRRISAVNPPEVILMIGVNGVGKTTTIAKLAHRARMQGKKVLIAAADTFRAAAVEQLKVWADRVGADFHCKDTGADPAAVAYEAMDKAVSGGYDVLFVDTAGRLQTKVNLMEELTKIRQVLGKKHQGAPHRSILVIDATTGQNALSQTRLFKEAAGVDELILTKLDGTAKGGVAIAVAMQYSLPITFVGLGEKLEDLRPFDGADFARALLGEEA